MKIGVIGAKGFIGSKLISKLVNSDLQINALSRIEHEKVEGSKISWFKGDLNEIDSLLEFLKNSDVVINCAGEVLNKEKFVSLNYQGTKNLYTASLKNNVSLYIHISSVGVYGLESEGKINESNRHLPTNDYEKSKALADKWLLDQKNIPTIILRPTTVYGPNMPNDSLKALFSAIKKRVFFFIGKKSAIANYISVGNVVEAIYKVLQNYETKKENLSLCEVFNISDDILFSDFIEFICLVSGTKLSKIRIPLSIIEFLIKLNKLSFNFSLALTNERANNISREAEFSNLKFVSVFGNHNIESHQNCIYKCYQEWFVD